MTELQKARLDWINAQQRIMELQRENARLQTELHEQQMAHINQLTQFAIQVTTGYALAPLFSGVTSRGERA